MSTITGKSFPIERKDENVVLVKMIGNKMNVISPQFIADFYTTLDVLDKDYPNDAIVLTGNGKAFSAGLDLKFMSSCFKNKTYSDLMNYITGFDNLCKRIFSIPRPVIAAIEGHAIAGGTCIATCCDFRYSNGTGSYGMNEVRNGMPIPTNMFHIVTYVIGKKNANEVFLQGNVFDAKEALRLGVLDEIVSDPIAKAVEKASYAPTSYKAYAQIKEMLKRESIEVMNKNKNETRDGLVKHHNLPAKL